jgi:BASS family bile acid:Na+ symporter
VAVDSLIGILAAGTLFAMMLAIGLTVRWGELRGTARNARLLGRVALANYVAVPAVTLALIAWRDVDPGVAAGFLMMAVCPGAPFAPAVAAMARGDAAAAAGLMALLAASSAVAAPVLMGVLLPMVMAGDAARVDAGVVAGTLFATQLAPLFAALAVHEWLPNVATVVRPLAAVAGKLLGAATAVLVLYQYGALLTRIRASGFVAMGVLLGVSLAAGWWAGRPGVALGRATALTTSLRNVGAALAIAGSSFAGTAAATSVIAYFFVEVLGSVAVAWRWRAAGSA